METVSALAEQIGVKPACAALALNRARFYRWRQPRPAPRPRPMPAWALSPVERFRVLDTLNAEYVDQAPAAIYAALLDQDAYLCSIRTMYRILASQSQVRERRNQARHPVYVKPERLATAPNQLWSWDITKLKGPQTWTYFYLYVILDVFSRMVVGWMIAHRESAQLAGQLITETCEKYAIDEAQLTLHADRGPSMTSKHVAHLLSDLGITKSHSRPYVSDDNPYSEAQFKTLKYRPGFPQRFGSFEDAHTHCRRFFQWYNTEHYHSGIGLLTPYQVHFGLSDTILAQRQHTLAEAAKRYPLRFANRRQSQCQLPKILQLPQAVWINKPESDLKLSSNAK
jgi:putative transposase